MDSKLIRKKYVSPTIIVELDLETHACGSPWPKQFEVPDCKHSDPRDPQYDPLKFLNP